jgi:hyaluronan synthase
MHTIVYSNSDKTNTVSERTISKKNEGVPPALKGQNFNEKEQKLVENGISAGAKYSLKFKEKRDGINSASVPLKKGSINPSLKSNEILFKLTLLFLGVMGLYFIVLLKSRAYDDLSLLSPLFIYTMAITTFQLSRLAGAMLYANTREFVYKNYIPTYEPTVSFVIPCKDEEQAIEKTIRKCFEAKYAKDKLEVIVINDGSTDGTSEVLNNLVKEFEKLKVINWKVNRGKRHGMAAGFKLAGGEIVVQLDSDSYIDPESFVNLIIPFSNPQIGAVCAHADPENADKNWLTKMQAAYYFMSFRVLKAAESSFMKVFCCSGCSSAYRKSVVLPILDEWLNETFLGLPVTWGDDRALTNWVIKQDFVTIYSDKVQAFTIVPEKFSVFLKQQIRWKKGWFVNSIFACKFIVKKDPFVSFSYFIPLILITLLTPFMATRALIYNPLVQRIMPWYYIAGVFSVAFVMTIYYRSVNRSNRYWPYMFLWSFINMVMLSFVLFYAIATIQNRKWGTR